MSDLSLRVFGSIVILVIRPVFPAACLKGDSHGQRTALRIRMVRPLPV